MSVSAATRSDCVKHSRNNTVMINENSHCVSVSDYPDYAQVEKNSSKNTKKNLNSSNTAQNSDNKSARSGLVYSSTSGTRPDVFLVDPHKARVKKMRCSVLTGSRLHSEDLSQGGFRYKIAMLTLTYKDLDAWRPRHISDLIRHVRNWCKRRSIDFRYVWVGELQKRGALHYHILIWLPKGVTLPKPDKQGWWCHGFTKIEWARHATGYIAKYASKGDDNPDGFPKGARIHGCGGLSSNARNEKVWWSMPSWIRETTSIGDMPRRNQGGGFLLKSTGEILESPWIVTGFSSRGVMICKKPNFLKPSSKFN